MNCKFTIFVAMMLMSFVSKAQFDYSPLKPFVPTGMLFEQSSTHQTVNQSNYFPLFFDGKEMSKHLDFGNFYTEHAKFRRLFSYIFEKSFTE